MNPIVLMRPYVTSAMRQNVMDTLHSRFIGQGPRVDEFEEQFKGQIAPDYHCVATGSGTDALHLAYLLAGIKRGSNVAAPLFTCLAGASTVQLSDGSRMRIDKIVNQRLPVEVNSIDPMTGKMEAKQVTGWVKLPSDNVAWYRIHCLNGKKGRGPGGQQGIWITGDHKVLTRRGYVRVDELSPSDEVATGQRELNPRQAQVMDGMMLGDGCISLIRKGYSRFEISHAAAQKEWFDIESKGLDGIPTRVSARDSYKQSGPAWTIQTHGGIQWSKLRRRWYPKGKKIVPEDLELTPRTLATWYMDDGSLSGNDGAIFCTDGFDRDSLWRLFWKLADYGFRPTIHGDRKRHLYLGNGCGQDSAKRFFQMIGGYVPPSMRYKVPDWAPAFDPRLWECGGSDLGFDRVVVERLSPPKSYKLGHVYCLEVKDNHNFISGDIVVSNCTATNLPLLWIGANVHFVDVEPGNLNMDREALGRLLGRIEIDAVVTVHYGGRVADAGACAWGCEVPLIEDCAQAAGAQRLFRNTPIFSCFSFQAVKHITTGDGGMLCCWGKGDADQARRMRWFGIDRTSKLRSQGIWAADISELGYKYQMTDIAASMGLGSLETFDSQMAHRRTLRAEYMTQLCALDGIRVLDTDPESACWLMTVAAKKRESLIALLKDRGIESGLVHYRNDRYSVFAECHKTETPNMDAIEPEYLCLPLHMGMGLSEVQYICDVIRGGW